MRESQMEAVKEERQKIIEEKIAELRQRVAIREDEEIVLADSGQPALDRKKATDLSRGLDWYKVARKAAGDRTPLMQSIEDCGLTFDELDAEFSGYSEEELQQIQEKLFVM
jgi:hypothetical protein